jgi:hypothetical protein
VLSILLWLWGTSGPPNRYSAFFQFRSDDLLRLAAGIRANLKIPHRIIAVTDYPRHMFPSELEYLHLPDHFGDLREHGGCWLRLKCFKPGMSALIGDRCAWIDLDSIITGTLDPLFNRPEPLVLYRSDSVTGQRWNGSVILFSPEQNEDIWHKYNPETAVAEIRALRASGHSGPRGTDQAHLHRCRDERTPHWSAEDGILHYGITRTRVLPEHARIVTFPGSMKPDTPEVRRRTPWIAAHWPLPGEVHFNGELPPVTPWPVTPSIQPAGPGRFKSMLKQRQEARGERRRMLNAASP